MLLDNDKFSPINKRITMEKFDELIHDADQAFWKVIADNLPAESGDLSPAETVDLQLAQESALIEWIKNNVPEPKLTIKKEVIDNITYITIGKCRYHLNEVVMYQADRFENDIGIITETCILSIGRSAKKWMSDGISTGYYYADMIQNDDNPIISRINL